MWLTDGAAKLPSIEAGDLLLKVGPSAGAVSGDGESKVGLKTILLRMLRIAK